MFENLRASLQFWYAKHFIKMERDYTIAYDFAREPNEQVISVKILRKYPGVIVELFDFQSDDAGKVSFDVAVIFNPNNVGVDSKRFKKYLDAIVRSILISAIEDAKNNGVMDEDGNTDIVESDSERAVHEEGSPVSEKRVSNRKPRKKGVRGNKGVRPKV